MVSKLTPSVFLIIIATLFVPVKAQINLALYGTAAQDTTYTENGIAYSANLAIKGPANNNWEDGCSSTGYQASTWWGFFLPRLAYITNIKSYYRKDEAQRMNDFRLYFANGSVYSKTELCFRDIGKQAHNNLNQSIDCNLSPTRNMFYFHRNSLIELCYIEINGCWKGFWGENCTVPCPPTCIDQHCNPTNGSCVWGCDSTNCMNRNCYQNTGACFEGCVHGRAGQYCNKYNLAYNQTANIFPVGQSNAGLSVDGLISTCIIFSSTATSSYLQVEFESLSTITTVHIVFGRDKTTADNNHAVYCSNTTDKWNSGTLLYSGLRLDTDIITFAVCNYLTYVPPFLSGNNMVELCEIEIGGCPPTHYGPVCDQRCPENCQGPCDLETGICIFGCLYGWTGDECKEACSSGTYGKDCLQACSTNCLNPTCNRMTGECIGECNDGWKGLDCTIKCPNGSFGRNCSGFCEGCISTMCDNVNGLCDNKTSCKLGYAIGEYCNTTCSSGTYGKDCLQVCSTNCLNPTCNRMNGECIGECNDGWKGLDCTIKCPNGSFGRNCLGFCDGCISTLCDNVNGLCDNKTSCKPGYEIGEYCNTSCDDWYFGNNCTRQCHCLEKPCDNDNGICSPEGCKEGWRGQSCDQACNDWYFGYNCAWKCYCLTGPCNMLTGECPPGGCQKGWHGVACEVTDENRALLPIQIGLFIGGFLLGIMMTAAACFLARKRRKLRKNQGKDNITEKTLSHEQQHYDDVRMENVSTYQDLMTRQTIHDYEHINTAFVRQ